MQPSRRHESPVKRTNPSGEVVWVARVTHPDGKRRTVPGQGTFRLKREAQAAIDAFHEEREGPADSVTVGWYAMPTGGFPDGRWLTRHPKSERTNDGYLQKLRAVMDVELDGRRLHDWPLEELQRRQGIDLVDHMLRVQGRSANGAKAHLRVLSSMWQAAMDDGYVGSNPWMAMRVKASDPRVHKPPRRIQTWTWEEMYEFAAAAGRPVKRPAPAGPHEEAFWDQLEQSCQGMNEWRTIYGEAMVRTATDTGVRLGELLALERSDVRLTETCKECRITGPHLHIRRTSWRGKMYLGTKTDHGEAQAGRECPLSATLAKMLAALPRRIDTRVLFPTLSGGMFGDRRFYRDVWDPARHMSAMWISPHECRHSYVSLMRAAGVDPADLAYWTGHTVATATAYYHHPMGHSLDTARRVLGG